MIYIHKIRGKTVEFYDAATGHMKRVINVAIFDGPVAVDVQGDVAAITCGDRRIYVYDIPSGHLKRLIQRNV